MSTQEPHNPADVADFRRYVRRHHDASAIPFGRLRPLALVSGFQSVQRVMRSAEVPAGSALSSSSNGITTVCVWQMRDASDAVIDSVAYLPESHIRVCSAGEVVACGRKDVVVIAPTIGKVFSNEAAEEIRREEGIVDESPSDDDDDAERDDGVADACSTSSLVLYLETDPHAWIDALQRTARRRSLSARVVFKGPAHFEHKVHLNIVNQKHVIADQKDSSALRMANFGATLLPADMVQFILSQGVTAEDLDPERDQGVIESCARIIMERSEPMASLKEIASTNGDLKLEDFLSSDNPKVVYEILSKIDSGMQGEVFRAERKADHLIVALKHVVIKKERVELPALTNEIAFLSAARHPNVVGLYSAHRVDRSLYMAMEFMGGGKLTDLLELPRAFTEKEIATMMREVLQGLAYLHRQGCVHRDIKSDNILVNSKGELKIGDFGFAASAVSSKRKTVVGTPYWMAPEVARGDPYAFPADVWSMGIFLIELCDGLPPWMGVPPLKALVKIATQPPPVVRGARTRVSKQCHDFSKLLLQKAQHKRSTCEDLLQHPFLAANSCHSSTAFLADFLELKKATEKTS